VSSAPLPSEDPGLDALLATAVSAARLAGSILREHVEKTLSVDAATQHDLKLEVDRLCDDAIRKKLSATYPAHSILTEESGQTTGLSPYQWIVDPLDGTVNYFHRIPYYCTSIACYRTPAQPAAGLGEPLIAVVYSPADDEMYTAVRNQGAFVNGTRLSTPAVSDLSQALVCTTHGSSPETKAQMQRCNSAILSRCRKIRCFGATALDLAWVARGRFGALYHPHIRTWDLAAGLLLISEAGGKIDLQPLQLNTWDLAVSAPGILDEFVALVRGA